VSDGFNGYKRSSRYYRNLERGRTLHPHPLTEGWDIYFFAIPLLVLMFFGYFRLDETFTTKKRTPKTPLTPPVPVVDRDGKSMCTDPDGRPWEARVPRRRRRD
jgi:hypothetical protein